MTADSRQRLLARLALATGILLFLIALRYTDWALLAAKGPRLIAAGAAAIVISGVWHLARTLAWSWCFPPSTRLPFHRLFRVRLAAEAVSYVTVRGVAGEPLKVVLLGREADARTATAAVALERLAYIVFTTLIVAIGALIAWWTLPLTATWRRVFLGFGLGSSVFIAVVGILVFRRRPQAPAHDTASRPHSTFEKVRRFAAGAANRAVTLLHEDPRRILVLFLIGVASYASMALEAWAVFKLAGSPISFTQALAVETFTRVASFATAAIPANLGALEAASLAAAAAVGSPTGSFLALARRVRGLFWAAAGFAVFPHRSTPAALSRAGEPDQTHDAYFADAPLRS
jgi:hypothetical protein